MLIYVESKAFPSRTFVVRVKPHETVARIRAQLLHILYELGREDHQFRLRFKGQFLRDAFTLEDYGIFENAIVKMVPLSRRAESMVDLQSMCSDDLTEREPIGPGILPRIKAALEEEIRVFQKRESLIFHFKGLLYIHFLCIWFCFVTPYWYSGFWVFVLWVGAILYCPTFTRLTGYIGGHSIHRNRFCIVYGIFSAASFCAAVYFSVAIWITIVSHGCKDFVFEGDCSHQLVFSGIFFGVHALCLLTSCCIAWILFRNMKVEFGDFVEKYLVQSRDIEDIMKAARSGKTKERRIAAFELATMAASGDDNKFRIVAEGGLEVLIHLALCKDEGTQEHAVEAVAELLTVPAIQDNLLEMGGMRTLSALLHAKSPRLVYQAATAISYIVSDSEESKTIMTENHGLEDLAHAAQSTDVSIQRIVAGIFLELAFAPQVRSHMASLNTPARALTKLCRSNDPETQRHALQTFELLAIESPDMICAQEDLLTVLLDLPDLTYDTQIFILASKILLYYAENKRTCEDLLDRPQCKESLLRYARTKDPILQKVVIKVIYNMLEAQELKYRARHLELDEILRYIRDHAADRETWDMADQALEAMVSDGSDGLRNLPSLTTMDKLEKMDSPGVMRRHPTNMSSTLSLHSSDNASLSDLKKGIN